MPGPDFIDRVLLDRSARAPSCATSARSSATDGSGAPATCRSCPSTRGSSTRPAASSPRTRPTSIPRTSSSWPSRAAATRSPRRSACLGCRHARYAHKIPFIVKINHNELLTYPEQVRPDHVRLGARGVRTWARSASARRSTSARTSAAARSRRSAQAFARGARAGAGHGAVVLPAQHAFKKDDVTTTSRADLTGQANHLGVTIEADIIKQKLPENNGGYTALEIRQDRPASTRSSRPTIRSI